MKKSLALILSLLVLVLAAFQLDFKKNYIHRVVEKSEVLRRCQSRFFNRDVYSICPFCDPTVVENQWVYRENGCMALLTHKPAVRGHMLIIPERHVERFEELTAEEMVKIHAMIAKVDRAERKIFGSTGYVLLEKNGVEAGQSVPHVHFHYLKMSKGDSKIWLAIRILIDPFLKPLSKEEMSARRRDFQEIS